MAYVVLLGKGYFMSVWCFAVSTEGMHRVKTGKTTKKREGEPGRVAPPGENLDSKLREKSQREHLSEAQLQHSETAHQNSAQTQLLE